MSTQFSKSFGKRLDDIEYQLAPEKQKVTVFIRDTDPPGTVQQKLHKWMAGEDVEGVRTAGFTCGLYEGGELEISVIRFVSCKRSAA